MISSQINLEVKLYVYFLKNKCSTGVDYFLGFGLVRFKKQYQHGSVLRNAHYYFHISTS